MPIGIDAVLLAALLLAIGLRITWVLLAPVLPVSEAAFYDQHARDLINDEGFRNLTTGEPGAFLPPGYPVMLGAVYRLTVAAPVAGAMLNVAAGAVTIIFAYLLCRRLFGLPAARLTAVLLAVFPSQVLYSNALNADLMLAALVAALAWLALGIGPRRMPRWRILLIGAMLGAAVLTAPKSILLLPALLIAWRQSFTWRPALRLAGTVLSVALLVIAPWTLRTWFHLGEPVFVATNGGVNFWIGNNPDADGGWMTWEVGGAGWGQPVDEINTDRQFRAEALRYAVRHPDETLRRALWKMNEKFASDFGYVAHFSIAPRGHHVPGALTERDLQVVSEWFFRVVFLSALLAVPGLLRRRSADARGVLAILAALTLPSLAFFGLDRFHVPMIPFLAVLAAPVLLQAVTHGALLSPAPERHAETASVRMDRAHAPAGRSHNP
ncbi:MAG: glycosyltransferase family 39 protein [Dehalococcoidia bacterium]